MTWNRAMIAAWVVVIERGFHMLLRASVRRAQFRTVRFEKSTFWCSWNEISLRQFGLAHLSVSEELSMNTSILVSLAIITLSTSDALGAHRPHHGRAMNPNASAAATNPNPYGGPLNAN